MPEQSYTFLGNMAKSIAENHADDLSQIAIILPGRRAGLFLRKELSKHLKTAVIAPDFFAVNQFFERLANQTISDRTSLLFELYLSWIALRDDNSEPFENFLNWAETALSDFNEIDNYQIDAKQIFKNLNEIRIIEEWSLNAEIISAEQSAYIAFWRDLGDLYFAFQNDLTAKNLNYAGKLKRHVAENIKTIQSELPWTKIYIGGLNALSATEQNVFFSLEKAGLAEIHWDADSFYMNDDSQEAGDFIRKYAGKKDFKGLSKRFLKKDKNIHVFGTASQIAQVKAVGEQLSASNEKESVNTAVVLTDESLLLPLLHSLPDSEEGINITLGYPLKWSPLNGLIDAIIQLQIRGKGNNRGEGRFYFKDVLAIINHPYIANILAKESKHHAKHIANIIHKGNFVFPNFENIKSISKSTVIDEIEFIFTQSSDVNALISILEKLLAILNKDALESNNFIENEYLFRYAKLIERINKYFNQYPFASEPQVLLKLLRQLVQSDSIPFYGEPLQGLQIMGMLETRALDFNKVILIGANEDLLPKPKYDQSFIPYDLKMAFGLPTYHQRDAIYAYYFYRLITGAKEVSIYYNAEPGDFGAGERSRFIAQLDHHLKKIDAPISVVEQLIKNPVLNHNSASLKLSKSADISKRLEDLLAYGLSPTALNTLLRCPLDFYFKYVAGLKEVESVEEELEASTFGSAIHDALEELYKPHIGEVLTVNHIKAMKVIANNCLDKAFEKNYSLEELKYGSNHISYEMARSYLQRFLDAEIASLKELEKSNQVLTLVALEQNYSSEIKLDDFGFDKKLTLKGKADRVDRIGDTIRIIDYKTGAVNATELKFESAEELTSSEKKSKALQLMLYLMVYNKSQNVELSRIEAGIISLRNISSGFMSLGAKANRTTSRPIEENDLEEFKNGLANLLSELFDESVPFEHRSASLYCDFCS